MHRSLICLFLLATPVAFSQVKPQLFTKAEISRMYIQLVPIDSLQYVDSTCMVLEDGVVFTGYISRVTRFGQLWVGQYKEGRPTGYAFEFDGTKDSVHHQLVMVSRPLESNEGLIEEIKYFKNGRVSSETTLRLDICPFAPKFDIIFGGSDTDRYPYKTYYENGNLKFDFPGNIPISGTIRSYYENGQMEYSKTFFNGKAYGKWLLYDEDGKCTGKAYLKANKVQRGFWKFEGEKKIRARKIRKMQRESLKKWETWNKKF